MTRERISLDGVWDFHPGPAASSGPSSIDPWRPISVPGPWQAQFDDLRQTTGQAWYRLMFDTPADWSGSTVILHFGAVDYCAEVWLNGHRLGQHEGGYLPFDFDVGAHLRRDGSNELLVRADDPSTDSREYPQWPFDQVPHGKQSWYGPLSGIWQPVWLERRSAFHIRAVRLIADLHDKRVQAQLTFSTPPQRHHEACQLRLLVLDPGGRAVADSQTALAAGAGSADLQAALADLQPWSPAHPSLYRMELELWRGSELLDRLSEPFGFRTIEAHDGRLYLNGEVLYLRGALDQDYYPDMICTPPSEAFLEDEMRKAKELGLNCLRCHIKVADPRYFAVADRIGMLVWAELPSWRLFSAETAVRARQTLLGMIERDGNHPSIIAWTIVNEGWGLDLVEDAAHRSWVKETYGWLKALDPTRLVVDNSPCAPNFHLQTDVDDYHEYRAIPDHRREWDEFVNGLAARPAWTFSPHGDAVRTGSEPLLVSEFGNWGLPDDAMLMDQEGREPWWFETGDEWGEAIVYPHGVRRRFFTWHLDQVFGNWPAFVRATQWQQYAALKYEVGAIRKRPEIAGYVITEFTDVHWECNGLLDMRRNPKAFHSNFAEINADTVVIPTWERVAYSSGELVHIGVVVAHGAGSAIAGAEVRWGCSACGVGGRFSVAHLQPGVAQSVGVAAFTAPERARAETVHLELELYSSDGQRLATNRLELLIFPRRVPLAAERSLAPNLWTPEMAVGERLAALGYRMTDKQDAGAVVAGKLDEGLLTYVREGGTLLLLAAEADALGPGVEGIRLSPREGSVWAGDWVSTFAWLRREGPFKRLPGGPLLDFAFDRVLPTFVLTGLRPLDFEAHVLAGLVVGWVHKPVALLAERRYGRGRLVLSCFRLGTDPPGRDPVATALLDGLLELAMVGNIPSALPR